MSDLNQPPADHRVKIPHLVFGLLFVGVAVIWALVVGEVITEDRLTVIVPGLLIAAGVVGLAVSLASGRNRRARDSRPDLDQHVPSPDQTLVDPLNDHTQEIR